MKTNEPSASYEFTRESTRVGTCCCSAVIQLTPKTSSPTPAKNPTPAITAVTRIPA
jgi:hypothetical protein